MGFGDALAQGIVGALGGMAQYPLDRAAEARKQRMLLEYAQAQKERRALLPIEEEKIRAEIGVLNRRNADGPGDGKGAVDKRVDDYIAQLELANGRPYSPRDKASIRAKVLERMILKPSGSEINNSEDPTTWSPTANLPSDAWKGGLPDPVLPPSPTKPALRPSAPATAPNSGFSSPDEVKAAVRSGKLTPQQGVGVLKSRFGFSD